MSKDKLNFNKAKSSNEAIKIKIEIIKEISDLLDRRGFNILDIHSNVSAFVPDTIDNKSKKKKRAYFRGTLNIKFDSKINNDKNNKKDIDENDELIDEEWDHDFSKG